MSTRSSSKRRPNKHPELVTREHELSRDQLVDIYRANSMRTIRDIRRGIVNEEDIDKLQNFVQTGVALMQIVSVASFRQAQRNAEITGFIHGTDSSVVLDPRKQLQSIEDEMHHPLRTLIDDVKETVALDELYIAIEHMAPVEQEAAMQIVKQLDDVFTTPHTKPDDEEPE